MDPFVRYLSYQSLSELWGNRKRLFSTVIALHRCSRIAKYQFFVSNAFQHVTSMFLENFNLIVKVLRELLALLSWCSFGPCYTSCPNFVLTLKACSYFVFQHFDTQQKTLASLASWASDDKYKVFIALPIYWWKVFEEKTSKCPKHPQKPRLFMNTSQS